MTASASDYSWVGEYRRGALHRRYGLALIQGLTPADFLTRLNANVQGDYPGLDAYIDRDREFQEMEQSWGDNLMVGVTAVQGPDGPWSLAFEVDGSGGIDERLMGPASVGTQIVSHHHSISVSNYFSWWQDGGLRTAFGWPANRTGTTPDALLDAMRRIGISEDSEHRTAEYFALAEDLTGIRVTADLLDNATYAAGIVTLPSKEWDKVIIDVTDASGERLHAEFTSARRSEQDAGIVMRPMSLDSIPLDEPQAPVSTKDQVVAFRCARRYRLIRSGRRTRMTGHGPSGSVRCGPSR
jgi:hypothetical protein